MVKLNELMEICEEENITVMTADCPDCGSVSLLYNGDCYIAVDGGTPENEKLERYAHEIGHCVRGAFYNRYSPFDIVTRYEKRADEWAVKRLISKDELIDAIQKNNDTIYLLAEYFGVSEDFMVKVCDYYGCYNKAE
jgi:Zn-dependent peptidase ImmA (M78 family)